MEFVEFGELTEQDWIDLIAGEREPFGPVGAGLEWQPKDRHVGVRTSDGRLLAAAGVLVTTVEVESFGSFEVVGLGSVIVTRSERGQGTMSKLFELAVGLAEGLGPDRMLLFCRPELVETYRRRAFIELASAVWVEQSGGPIEMPMRAMWRALHDGAQWPPGRVDVQGLPF